MTLGDATPHFDVVLVGHGDEDIVIDRLVNAAGGRVSRRLDWSSANRLVDVTRRAVVLADLATAGDDVEAVLDQLELHRGYTGCQVIVAAGREQIDLADALLNHAVQLVSAPDDADLVAALTIAGVASGAARDASSESETARLQRLNEEVARIAEALSRLTKRDGPVAIANDVRSTFETRAPDITIEAGEIRRVIRARRLRDRQFGQGLFEDPAWDMILDLFAAEIEHGQVSVSSLCVAAAVAPTTALRWIGKLTDAGLFRRQPDPFDRRRAFIELSPAASTAIRSHLATLRAAGLPLA